MLQERFVLSFPMTPKPETRNPNPETLNPEGWGRYKDSGGLLKLRGQNSTRLEMWPAPCLLPPAFPRRLMNGV